MDSNSTPTDCPALHEQVALHEQATLHAQVTLHPQVASTVVDDQAVVILADDGVVNVLNPLGTRIWALIDGARTVGEIAQVIEDEYDVSPEVAVRDTAEFLQALADARAVVLHLAATTGVVVDL